jgi:hypothetical protein
MPAAGALINPGKLGQCERQPERLGHQLGSFPEQSEEMLQRRLLRAPLGLEGRAALWFHQHGLSTKLNFPLAPEICSGEIYQLVTAAAHHGPHHVEREALRHLHRYGRGHGELGSVDDRIHQYRPVMR